MARQLVLAIAFGAFATAAAQSPPPIGTHYSTTVAMNQDGVASLGRLYATGDWTLFESQNCLSVSTQLVQPWLQVRTSPTAVYLVAA
jgi:hypothetical protein